MKILTQKRWTLVSVLGLAYWFYGNMYEGIVFSPNWVVDSPAQMKRLNEFFINTSPTTYFIPLTLFPIIITWVLLFLNKEKEVKKEYRLAGIFTLMAVLLTVYIVSALIMNLFGENYLKNPEKLNFYCRTWNLLNIFRIILVATASAFMFNAYRKLDKR